MAASWSSDAEASNRGDGHKAETKTESGEASTRSGLVGGLLARTYIQLAGRTGMGSLPQRRTGGGGVGRGKGTNKNRNIPGG